MHACHWQSDNVLKGSDRHTDRHTARAHTLIDIHYRNYNIISITENTRLKHRRRWPAIFSSQSDNGLKLAGQSGCSRQTNWMEYAPMIVEGTLPGLQFYIKSLSLVLLMLLLYCNDDDDDDDVNYKLPVKHTNEHINQSVKVKVKRYSSSWQVISELRGVTCHTGSHSVTFHPTQVNSPHLTPARQAGTRFTYTGGMEGWVDLGDLLHTEIVYPPADGHPSKY